MNFIRESGRIYLPGPEGQVLAQVLFPSVDETTVDIISTFVDDSLRGQGVADKLLTAVQEELVAQGKTARLTCSYAVKWYDKNGLSPGIAK
jgi:predicted GNAT family acetyltransferase